ncbi:MAG: hypothetical protein KGV56_02465 [Gammaproteobacteria bacterium]|nr:hypothetical protein [Gammaproteobacteria bacterium]
MPKLTKIRLLKPITLTDTDKAIGEIVTVSKATADWLIGRSAGELIDENSNNKASRHRKGKAKTDNTGD